jgi:hypothetical protein
MKNDRLVIKLFVYLVLSSVIVAIMSFKIMGYQDTIEELEARPTPTATVVTPGPTKTKVVMTPGPTVTVRVTERASRSVTRARTSASASVTLACIRFHESTNNYLAVSDSGTYRGAYQLSRVYSPAWAERAGYGQWAGIPADKWPPAVQDAVAAHMGRSGWGHWSRWTSYDCPGF